MNKKTIGRFNYYSGWSYELSEDQINGYVELHKKVFESSFSTEDFDAKFVRNIFGPSVHVLVYDGDMLIAIRSLWRNDLGTVIAYQPCDTAVSADYRGFGIFKVMTDEALVLVGDAEIYNFPNDNSRRLYLKNGWIIHRELNKNLFSIRGYNKHCQDAMIPDEYVKWYFERISSLCVIKKGRRFWLLSPRGKGMYIVIGEISEDVYRRGVFKTVHVGVLFFRSSCKSKIRHLNHSTYIVVKGEIKEDIPSWKVDAV